MMVSVPGQVPTPTVPHGMARTPGAPLTPIAVRTPGPPHTPGTAHTPGGGTPGSATPGTAHTPGMSLGMVHTPASMPTTSSMPVHRGGPSRHFMFATHFPIAADEPSTHESNQRMVVLYGVGRQRDEARHAVKKATKEIAKLFGKKASVDIGGGDPGAAGSGRTKKKKEKDGDPVMSLENTFNKFRKLSYYDQHAVTHTVARSVAESVGNFASGAVGGYLPVIDNVSYLFDLMEYCLNIGRLLDLTVQVGFLLFMNEFRTVGSGFRSLQLNVNIMFIIDFIVGLVNGYRFDGNRFYNHLPVSKFKNR